MLLLSDLGLAKDDLDGLVVVVDFDDRLDPIRVMASGDDSPP